ncbi:hypothetical protein OC834_002674 [Tilletia horrida]|nr:hypothetical protein OC834_002674 [Tilletia horrida]
MSVAASHSASTSASSSGASSSSSSQSPNAASAASSHPSNVGSAFAAHKAHVLSPAPSSSPTSPSPAGEAQSAFLSVRSGVFGIPTLAIAPTSQDASSAAPQHEAEFQTLDAHEAHQPDQNTPHAQPTDLSEQAIHRQYMISYFVAGGAAGAASRTVVSPLERLKILQQVQPASTSASGARPRAAYSGVWQGLVKMWREEGFRGYMRGNATNCIRIAPYSAVQFTTYEALKEYLQDPVTGKLNDQRKLTAGALAGIASVISTYPLDLVRSRISVASASLFDDAPKLAAASSSDAKARLRAEIAARQRQIPGIWEMTLKVYREEGGWRGLYRGCIATSAGVAPYVSLNFFVYEALRAHFVDENGDISTISKLACGGVAGSISQTLTYPLDVLRRRMQMIGMKDARLGMTETTSWAVIRNLFQAEGVRGLYRGLFSNLLKVAPSIATSFTVYETVQQLLEPKVHQHAHQ